MWGSLHPITYFMKHSISDINVNIRMQGEAALKLHSELALPHPTATYPAIYLQTAITNLYSPNIIFSHISLIVTQREGYKMSIGKASHLSK